MIAGRTASLLLAALVAVSACAKSEPAPTEKVLELGPHRVHVLVPVGWELVDQGAQKRFRHGESEIVLQNLGKAETSDPEQRADWGLAALTPLRNDERRDVTSRLRFLVGGHDAIEIETWNRLDHTWPQRLLFVQADDDLLALHTTRLADDQTVKAFESIRDSLHFISP